MDCINLGYNLSEHDGNIGLISNLTFDQCLFSTLIELLFNIRHEMELNRLETSFPSQRSTILTEKSFHALKCNTKVDESINTMIESILVKKQNKAKHST